MKPSLAVLLTLQLCVSAEDLQQNVGHNREGKGLITDMLGLLSGFSSVVDELQDHAMGEVSFNISSLPLCVHNVSCVQNDAANAMGEVETQHLCIWRTVRVLKDTQKLSLSF